MAMAGRSREDSQSPAQGLDYYCSAPVWLPLPHGYHFPLAALPGQLTHMMGSRWRDLVSLGWQDTQRNLVTVSSCGSRMPISPGDPRGY